MKRDNIPGLEGYYISRLGIYGADIINLVN